MNSSVRPASIAAPSRHIRVLLRQLLAVCLATSAAAESSHAAIVYSGALDIRISQPSTSVEIDIDDNGTVDLGLFEICASGPGVPCGPLCRDRDLDSDGDVDQADFAVFQRCYSGENIRAEPNCGD